MSEKKAFVQRYAQMATAISLGCTAFASAASAEDNVFDLGKLTEITVVGKRLATDATDNAVTVDEVWTFNRTTLDEAVKLIPGVTSTLDSTARRNERGIYVRGFGRFQVPLSIDGIRIYLPADNRLDFNRFLTQDLAEIEVQKGYVSVLDGPGGMGGAINLVTRKPTKPLETELRTGVSEGEWDAYALVGTRRDKFYAQGSVSYLDRDYWKLSDDFMPTAIEDGGKRDQSDSRDSRYNLKFGWTPNTTDEYSLSYTAQSGEKGAPLHVYNNPPNPPNSFWRWPTWDIGNVYWLSSTALGANEATVLKTRAFYNTYENTLSAYDNATYTAQSANGRFNSFYDDHGFGGSVELDTPFGARNSFGAAVHYRRDEHSEYNDNRPTNPALRNIEPKQETLENTWSIALENTFAATTKLDIVTGASHDANDLKKAQEFNTTAGLFEYPTGGSSANNAQAAAYWRYADGREIHGVVSSRTRFATIFERFSTRFGSAVPNPNLDPERAVNYEIGWGIQPNDRIKLTTALFYADVTDMIQTVVVTATPTQITQTQNVGDGRFYGVELGVQSRLSELWRVAANYTYLDREIKDALQPNFQVVGAPDNSAFVAFTYEPSAHLSVTPSIEVAGDRWSDVTGGTYIRTGNYTLLSLQVQYRHSDLWEVAFGGSNLLDENYELAQGYPEQGRNAYVRMRLNF